MAHIRKTPAGTFQAVIKYKSKIIKRKTFRTRGLAQKWAKTVEADRELIAALQSGGAAVTFSQLIDEWTAQYTGKDKTLPRRVDQWRKWLGDMKVSDLTSDLVKLRLNQYASGNGLRHAGKGKLASTGKPRTAATVNRMRAALATLIKYANSTGITTTDLLKNVPRKTEHNQVYRYLGDQYHPQDEQQRLIKACKASSWDRLYLFVLMALATGARASELLNLRWKNINFESKTAHLPDTKNGLPRNLALVDSVLTELKQVRGIGDALVFPGRINPRKPAAYHGPWKQALKQAGIDGLRFHDLRHTCASWFVLEGKTLHETAIMLGHKSEATTRRYAHLSDEHMQQTASDVMSKRLGGES